VSSRNVRPPSLTVLNWALMGPVPAFTRWVVELNHGPDPEQPLYTVPLMPWSDAL
jgi:hypothetical protein